MAALGSLLVQNQIVGVKQIEQALQHQVIHGGSLETNLLELGLVDEEVLAEYAARSRGMPVLLRELLDVPNQRAIKILPWSAVDKHRILPIRLENTRMIVAADEQPQSEDLDEISFILNVRFDAYYVHEFRLAMGLNRHYGIPMSPRMIALQRRCEPDFEVDQPPTVHPPSMAPGLFSTEATDPGAPSSPHVGTGRIVSIGPPPGAKKISVTPKSDFGSEDTTAKIFTPGYEPERGEETRERIRRTAELYRDKGRAGHPGAVSEKSWPQGHVSSVPDVGGPGEEELPVLPTLAEARERLDDATTRDEILDVVVDFARQAFEFLVLLVVHGKMAQGRTAVWGRREKKRIDHLAIPLDRGGMFETAFETGSFYLGPPGMTNADDDALKSMGRAGLRNCAILPMSIRHRVILLLYGDGGQKGVRAEEVSNLARFCRYVSEAFERLLIKRKRGDAPEEDLRTAPRKREPLSFIEKLEAQAAASYEPEDPAEEARAVAAIDSEGPAERNSSGDGNTSGEKPGMKTSIEPSNSNDSISDKKDNETSENGKPESRPEPAQVETPVSETGPEAPKENTISWAGRYHVKRDEVEEKDRSSLVDELAPRRSGRKAAQRRRPSIGDLERGNHIGPSGFRNPLDELADHSPREGVRAQDDAAEQELDHDRFAKPRGATYAVAAKEPESEGNQTVQTSAVVSVGRHDSKARSVIVEMREEITRLIERILSPGPFDEAAATLLMGIGDDALTTLVRYFPGPLKYDRYQVGAKLPRVSFHGPLLKLFVKFGSPVTPHVLPLLESFDSDIRFYATFLFSEVTAPEALAALTDRLFDPDRQVRALAADVIRQHARFPEFRWTVRNLTEILDSMETKVDAKRLAAVALGELKVAQALRPLARMLDSADQGLMQAAHQALVKISFNDFGFSQPRWLGWLDANNDRHRLEWAIASLEHPVDRIRAAAMAELKKTVGEEVEWPARPGDARQMHGVKKQCESWWRNEGAAFHLIQGNE